MRKIQIGIMGSQSDLKYSKECEDCAKEIGKLIAESGNILVYGAEKEYNSLSTIAAINCSKNNGITVGITFDKDKNTDGDFNPTVIIPSGLGVGGGREFTLVLSCDVIICLSGGSGTLNEICVAYQAGIPIIVLDKCGGWASKLADTYLDDRKRLKCISVSNSKDAVNKAISIVRG